MRLQEQLHGLYGEIITLSLIDGRKLLFYSDQPNAARYVSNASPSYWPYLSGAIKRMLHETI